MEACVHESERLGGRQGQRSSIVCLLLHGCASGGKAKGVKSEALRHTHCEEILLLHRNFT